MAPQGGLDIFVQGLSVWDRPMINNTYFDWLLLFVKLQKKKKIQKTQNSSFKAVLGYQMDFKI